MQELNAFINRSTNLEVMNRDGAAHELRGILLTNLPSFYRSAYRVLGNPADAEDAVQDAMLAAYKHLNQFQGRSQMSTWLTAIVQNAARMQMRMRHRHVYVSLDEPIAEDPESSLLNRLADGGRNPEEECRDSELNHCLREVTSQLSPTLLRTFQLRDIEGLSIRETAKILGVPNGTVKARLARARKKLKYLMRRTLTSRAGHGANSYQQQFAA